MLHHLSREFSRLALGALAVLAFGFFLGYPVVLLVIGLAGYAAWHVYNAAVLVSWLDNPTDDVPDTDGIWAEIVSRVYRWRKGQLQNEKNLRGVIDRFQRATKVLPDAVVVLTSGGEIEAFNRTARRLLGLKSPDDLGQPISNYFRMPEVVQIVEDGDPGRVLEIPSPRDADRWLTIQVIPYTRDERLLFVARDVTQLRRLDVMRQDFVANVSHELKTPLTVISGYIEALRERADGASFEGEALASAEKQTLRMRSIVDDLLQLATMETSELLIDREPVDVNLLVADIKAVVGQLASDELQVSFSINKDLFLRGNRRELFAAFNNLVVNAVRYTPAGGTVNVSWKRTPDGAAFIVEDTGEGIPEEDVPRLTERFYRVDDGRSRDTGGTGLGLAIVKHVLLRHDAALDIASVVGEGTQMSCVFPRDSIIDRTPVDRSHIRVVEDSLSDAV